MKATSFHIKPSYPGSISAASSGDTCLNREEMIIKYTSLIKYNARRLAMRLPPHISIEDLCSAGVIGLIDALKKFDPGKKVQFKTYAEYRIRGAMLDEIRSQDWAARSVRQKASQLEKAIETLQKKNGRAVEDEEVAQELGLSLDSYYDLLNETKGVFFSNDRDGWGQSSPVPTGDFLDQLIGKAEDNPFDLLGQEEAKKIITQAIEDLPIKEKMVISLYYYDDLTLREIGEVLGFTESRICQLHSKAISKLKVKVGNYFNGAKNSFESSHRVKEWRKTHSLNLRKSKSIYLSMQLVERA